MSALRGTVGVVNPRDTTPRVARRRRAGLNGEANQRAASELLINAVDGIWLAKLGGWPQYVRPFDGTRIPEGLWIDWRQLREDLEADERARAEFSDWATSYTGRRADEVEYERTHDRMVPRRAVARGQ